jgi:hypothetical protein
MLKLSEEEVSFRSYVNVDIEKTSVPLLKQSTCSRSPMAGCVQILLEGEPIRSRFLCYKPMSTKSPRFI